ncbi:MAG: hypothetical protein JWN40_5927 [Phycisphaerales bacterium]|nr:hypothetical protein [Phycisphaerales bacterium]
MRRTMVLLVAVLICAVFVPLARSRAHASEDQTALCIAALSENKEEASWAILALRAEGPSGLEALVSTYQAAIDRHRRNPTKSEPMWDRLAAALDGVAAQKDAWAAGLYWYTDLGAAQRAAKESGRPILSLRLLGTLDTEFSCANSRFFRTVLYPDAAVGRALREGFVLHWQSHRPVPKLTIDFGDGRKIERTITGNSVHYVLTPNGRVVDVIPGLYGPAAFLRAVTDASGVARAADRADFNAMLATYHETRLVAGRRAWDNDLRTVGAAGGAQPAAAGAAKPTAMAGTRITASKMAVELRPLLAMTPDRGTLEERTDEATWAKIAALHAPDARLDASSRAVILSKGPDAVAANLVTVSKKFVEDPTVRMIRNFERSVAEDTVRNEYLFHGQIHEWFVRGQALATLDELNEKVYAQLFLMPRSDPWLGLVPADTYTALPADATALIGKSGSLK